MAESYSEIIELRGHIIDSMILPAVMDEVMDRGGEFVVEQIDVGRRKDDPSYARIQIAAPTRELLQVLVDRAQRLGATTVTAQRVRCEAAPADGLFPDDFYSTTNLDTQVMIDGHWVAVQYPEMDCAIVVDFARGSARTTPHSEVHKGDQVVVGHLGVRVLPLERPRRQPQVFAFMGSSVSSEKPKSLLIKEIAEQLQEIRRRAGRTLVVAGPVLVHTGMRGRLVRLIEEGYVHGLFAGNGLATHDIECALFGTSLGVSLAEGVPLEGGHEHHLRAVNRIRQAGSIPAAVEQGILTSGIMYACVRQGVKYVLAGSIRDDGPLPDVITDVVRAQEAMRTVVRDGVDLVMILSSMLHGIATGNLLPARVTTVCVDISPAVVTKLTDRGSFQTIGLVMDVEGFLRELSADLRLD
ncbi:MAG TPA: TIGR00300 family protein [Chloroflexota bacterium]|nr:TIGR00300 family protein [Chloroflexota bacterium]